MLEDLARILGILSALIVLIGLIWKGRGALGKLWIHLKNWYYGTFGLVSAKTYLSGLNRNQLAEVLAEHYENCGFKILRVDDTLIPLIVNDGWIPKKPLDSSKIKLEWKEILSSFPMKWEGLAKKLVKECKSVIEDNPTYRLISIEDGDAISLRFGPGRYNDYIETCEALAWELALSVRPSLIKRLFGKKELKKNFEKCKKLMVLKRRNNVNVLDLGNRSAAVGINALTVITCPDESEREATFLIHQRGETVAEGIGALHVIPAGTFQPLHESDAYHSMEFSIKWTILREFGEEILNKENIIKTRSFLDPKGPFNEDEELKQLYLLFKSEGVEIYFLGIGLDCITLKPEIMMLLLVNGKIITDHIPRLKDGLGGNWEGKRIGNRAFKKEELKMLIDNAYMTPAGKGCCGLAMEHFDWIQKKIENLSANA